MKHKRAEKERIMKENRAPSRDLFLDVLLTVALFLVLGCSTAVPIKPENISFQSEQPNLVLPVKAILTIHIAPDDLAKTYVVRSFTLPEGKLLQTAGLKVFGRLFQAIQEDTSPERPHMMAILSGTGYIDDYWGTYTAEVAVKLLYGNGEFIDTLYGSAKTRSSMVNDVHAFENAYIRAITDIADQMLRHPKLAPHFTQGFGDELRGDITAVQQGVSGGSQASSSHREPSKYDGFMKSVLLVRTQNGLGSAFLVNEKGFALTNAHVIGNDGNPSVTLFDGRTLFAQVVSRDDSKDVALLRIVADNFPWLQLSSDTRNLVGNEIIAIGAPFAFDYTVSKGIISAYREEQGVTYLQTDTALNVGNSGGPLISLETGEVVGMVVSGLRKDIAEGMNFAIAASTLRTFLEQRSSVMDGK